MYLIPETLRVTILGDKAEGDTVNIEIDSQTQVKSSSYHEETVFHHVGLESPVSNPHSLVTALSLAYTCTGHCGYSGESCGSAFGSTAASRTKGSMKRQHYISILPCPLCLVLLHNRVSLSAIAVTETQMTKLFRRF